MSLIKSPDLCSYYRKLYNTEFQGFVKQQINISRFDLQELVRLWSVSDCEELMAPPECKD